MVHCGTGSFVRMVVVSDFAHVAAPLVSRYRLPSFIGELIRPHSQVARLFRVPTANGVVARYSLSLPDLLGRTENNIAMPVTSAIPPKIGGIGLILCCSSVAWNRRRTGDAKYASERAPRPIRMIPATVAIFTEPPYVLNNECDKVPPSLSPQPSGF